MRTNAMRHPYYPMHHDSAAMRMHGLRGLGDVSDIADTSFSAGAAMSDAASLAQITGLDPSVSDALSQASDAAYNAGSTLLQSTGTMPSGYAPPPPAAKPISGATVALLLGGAAAVAYFVMGKKR